MKKTEVIIIGGGLTGLTLAHLLQEKNISFIILEGRNRLGGRIHTLYKEEKAPMEMGATWLGKKHTHLIQLLEKLGLDIFVQELSGRAIYEPLSTSPPQLVSLPHNPEPSYRIKGGTSTLIKKLESLIPAEAIHLSSKVNAVSKEGNEMIVQCENESFQSQKVVSTLPPYLLNQTIDISPELPSPTTSIMNETHTWMGESIKIGLYFKEPFWRDEKLSGTIFSNVGPIPEFYDHSNFEDNLFALKGFLNGSYYSVSKEERLDIILKQLRKYYGKLVDEFIDYEETVWSQERFTFSPYQGHILPHQHNGHPIFQKLHHDGQFFIAGSETSSHFPGYMNGAVASAYSIARQL